eukprot:1085870-Prymnesium_polylepis.1
MSPLSHSAQLKELFDTLKGTHGGPAFISGTELKSLRRRVLGEQQHELCDEYEGESTYVSRATWVMSQLDDPYAAYLSPAQVTALRERFHGAVGVGLHVDESARWWSGIRVPWRRNAESDGGRRGQCLTIERVEAGSPAERAGIV